MISFAIHFGGIGFFVNSLMSGVLVLVELRGGDQPFAALLIPTAVVVFALLEAGINDLFARMGDPPDLPADPSEQCPV